MIKAYFDSPAFLQAIDQIRLDRKLSWYQVTKAMGLDPNNIRRVGTREKNGFNSNAVAALVLWSGLDLVNAVKSEHFLTRRVGFCPER